MLTTLKRKRIRSKLLVALSFLWIPIALHATNGFAKTEQDIKAAYLYNFMKFIAWPNFEEEVDFNLCIIGDDPANETIKRLDVRKIQQHTLNVEHFYSLDNSINCHAVFVGESEHKFIDKIVEHYAQTPTLTVSSTDNFIHKGGIIGFIKLGNLIRFDINLKQARQTQLSISSKLLELAHQVEK